MNTRMTYLTYCKTIGSGAEIDPLCRAVDTLLGRLAAEAVSFLRIGRRSQVEPLLHDWMPGGSQYPDTSAHGLAATAAVARVVSMPSGHACPNVRNESVHCCEAIGRQTFA